MLGLEPIEEDHDFLNALLRDHVHTQTAHDLAKQSAIDKEFEMNMNHYPDQVED